MRFIFFGALFISLLASCSFFIARITYDFEELTSNPAIHYEKNMDDIAINLAAAYASSISLVEHKLEAKFKDPDKLEVFIFSNMEHYWTYSNSKGKSRASTGFDGIYISPEVRQQIDRLNNIFVHELSHAHLRQYIGSYRFANKTPQWFIEGLAVSISSGAGAEKVSHLSAIEELRKGNIFSFYKKNWHNGLNPHLAYRQAGMFIEYLRLEPEKFSCFYKLLIEKLDFNESFIKSFGGDVETVFDQYLLTI